MYNMYIRWKQMMINDVNYILISINDVKNNYHDNINIILLTNRQFS
jgi:hypothetical protein